MRIRSRDPRDAADEPLPEPAAGRGDDETLRRAQRLLDLGDDAIRRALSGDSKRFLSQNRQEGGE